MKEILKDKERTIYLVKKWTTKAGLPARIQQCVWNKFWAEELGRVVPSLPDHYTGYVQPREGDTKKYYDKADIEVHGGVTFDGEQTGVEGRWVGFDMAHLGDENIADPIAYATEECEKLATQLL